MSGLFPLNGVTPANSAGNTIANPTLADGCSPLWYSNRCNGRFDPSATNALISEIINAVNCLGVAYDCNVNDNLCTALQTLQQTSTSAAIPRFVVSTRHPYHAQTAAAEGPIQTIPTGTLTQVQSMTIDEIANIAASAWNGAVFTVPVGLDGLWTFDTKLNVLGEIEESHYIRVNGDLIHLRSNSVGSGSSNVDTLTRTIYLSAGDTVDFLLLHESGADRDITQTYVAATQVRPGQ